MSKTAWIVSLLVVPLFVAASADAGIPPPGSIVYINDGFEDDTMQGWTSYRQTTAEWPVPMLSNPTGTGFDQFNPTYNNMIATPLMIDPPNDPDLNGIVGAQIGWCAVLGDQYTGITKSFYDEFIPNEMKHIEVWWKAWAVDYGGAGEPDAIDLWIGVAPGQNADRAAATWAGPFDMTGVYREDELLIPCEEGWETVFVEFRTGFHNGQAWASYIDHVTVWQTPEPAALVLLGLGGLAALRRRRRIA